MNVDEAYARCAEITNAQAKNFSYGIRLLPAPKRAALSAVYALARRVDDIGDGDLSADQKLAALAQVRADLAHLPGGGDDPVLVAIDDAARRYDLPMDEFAILIDGCEMDVTGAVYVTFDDLVGYCRRVAGSIGRLSLAVFGTTYPESAEPRAEALGVALQVTNILRDVVEDRGMGRVYLPQDDAKRFGCELDLSGPPDAVAALVSFETSRAREWFGRGLELLPLLDRRVSLPAWEKAWVAARSLAGAPA